MQPHFWRPQPVNHLNVGCSLLSSKVINDRVTEYVSNADKAAKELQRVNREG
jgi:hypothetical protein